MSRGESNWDGCDCYFASLNERSIQPNIRYWDYDVAETDLLFSRLEGPWPAGLLPVYFSGMPVGARDRMNSAAFASSIGLSWILAHEESHYRNGHMHMLSELLPSSDDTERMLFAEGGSSDLPTKDSSLMRKLEWNADTSATNAVVDIFFDKAHLEHLPENCPRNAEWLLRLVVSGILLPVMLFDRASQFSENNNDHPSGLCRLICIIATACRRVTELVRPGPRFRAEVAEFANLMNESDLFTFDYRIVMGALTEVSVVGEILENENSEGKKGSLYKHPMGEGDNIPQITNETLRTMYKPEAFSLFAEHISEPPMPSERPRLSAPLFEEVRSYLHNDPQTDPIVSILNGYSEALAAAHRAKIVSLLGKRRTAVLFGG